MNKELEPLTLTDSEIKDLETLYKQEGDRRMAERMPCIILYVRGYELKELQRILMVGIRTLKRWIKTFIAQGIDGLRQWGYKGQACVLSDEQWAEVEKELERKPYHYAKQVVAFVKKRFGVEYSQRGMQALLRRKGYRRIKTRIVPGQVDEEKQQEQREFIEDYFKLKAALGPIPFK
ncbi:MAG: winged helix-turn-helix domain-containing protein [Anaerolineae bacterium]|nr:winged helix-turn-helix domain-containing protein [Anaerolineae bacterium]